MQKRKKNYVQIISENRNIIFIILMISTSLLWIESIFAEGVYSNRYTVFFNRTIDFFGDFTNMVGLAKDRNPYFGEQPGSYPPLAYLIFYLFSNIVEFPVEKYLFIYSQPQFLIIAIISIIFLILVYVFFLAKIITAYAKKSINTEGFFLIFCLILSYPIIYTIERGNILLLAMAMLIGFFAFKDSDSKVCRELSLIFLALSFALKITPAIFGILLLSDKRYKESIRCVLYGVTFFFLPFLFFKHSLLLNIKAMIINMSSFSDIYQDLEGLGLTNSFKKLVFLTKYGSVISLTSILPIVRKITIVLCVLLLISVFFEKEEWKKMMILTLIAILLPSHTNSYYIIYFIPATLVFLITAEKNMLNFLLMLVQSLFYCIYIYSFSNIFYNIAIPILTIYFVVESIRNIYKAIKKVKIKKIDASA